MRTQGREREQVHMFSNYWLYGQIVCIFLAPGARAYVVGASERTLGFYNMGTWIRRARARRRYALDTTYLNFTPKEEQEPCAKPYQVWRVGQGGPYVRAWSRKETGKEKPTRRVCLSRRAWPCLARADGVAVEGRRGGSGGGGGGGGGVAFMKPKRVGVDMHRHRRGLRSCKS